MEKKKQKLESQIQKELLDRLELEGFYCIKLMKTNKNGIPDVIALKPGEPPVFYEVKRPSESPTKLQEFRHKELREKGFTVIIYKGKNV